MAHFRKIQRPLKHAGVFPPSSSTSTWKVGNSQISIGRASQGKGGKRDLTQENVWVARKNTGK